MSKGWETELISVPMEQWGCPPPLPCIVTPDPLPRTITPPHPRTITPPHPRTVTPTHTCTVTPVDAPRYGQDQAPAPAPV